MGKKQNDVIDIKLAVEKQKIRIDGDDNRIIELDTSDLSVLTRLNEYYPKLKELEAIEFLTIKRLIIL